MNGLNSNCNNNNSSVMYDSIYQPATMQNTANQQQFNSTWYNRPQVPNMHGNGFSSNNTNQLTHTQGAVSNIDNWSSANIPSNSISLRPETLTNTDFLPAYLAKFVGKWIRAEFFISGAIEQRVGILHEVGASYIIIEAIEPATLIVCDIFSLKFATIVLDDNYGNLLRSI